VDIPRRRDGRSRLGDYGHDDNDDNYESDDRKKADDETAFDVLLGTSGAVSEAGEFTVGESGDSGLHLMGTYVVFREFGLGCRKREYAGKIQLIGRPLLSGSSQLLLQVRERDYVVIGGCCGMRADEQHGDGGDNGTKLTEYVGHCTSRFGDGARNGAFPCRCRLGGVVTMTLQVSP
jgi:hypothetical protein